MIVRRVPTVAAVLGLMVCVAAARGAAPEQFRVWGSAGPEFPPAPKGWKAAAGASDGPAAAAHTPEDKRRGFVVFARAPQAPATPETVPYPSERAAELKTFATPGEYEPLTFLLHAMEPLEGVQVRTGPLRSPEGGEIPPDHLDVRIVRCIRVTDDAKPKTYRLEPFLLEKRPAFAVAADKTAQVWLTLKVPPGAKAGEYEGQVSVQAPGREALTLKLSLRVLPFSLPEPPVEVSLFYPRPPAGEADLVRQLTDMREHGCNAIEPAFDVQIVTRDQDFGADDVAATREHCKRMMAASKRVFGPPRFGLTFGVGHQIAFYWDTSKAWFVFWPHSKKIEDDLFKAIGVVRDLARAEGWPGLRAYALDEAGAHNLLDEAVYYYGLIKKRMGDLGTWTSIGGGMAMGHDEIGQLAGVVDFLSTNRFTPQIAEALVKRNKPYGVYNGCGPTQAGARFFFGFYGFKTGAGAISQWVYHFGNGVFEGDGIRRGDEGYVYLAPDGPLPSLMSEAVREGIDDCRYVHLLWRLIAAAKASDRPAARAAAENASRELTGILGTIDWGFQAMQGAERTPPPHPAALRKWRLRVAGEILKLQAAMGAEPSKASQPPAVSPLDFPWAQPPAEQVRYGPELLPASGFEAGPGPWRVEAWNGKGSGKLDETIRHGGKRSMRIDVPAASGSQAVTVLVWPNWGDGKLNVALEGGRAHELSAWCRWQGRGTPPGMRLALPEGTERSSRDGRDEPAADGWQRLWVRVEPNFRIVPKYLGVWVQGPGTVWIDDLSLREVIPPALRLDLDQVEYDGLDKVAVATLNVAAHAAPAKVRFTLAASGGRPLAELTAPFEGSAPVSSDAAKLAAMIVAPVKLASCRFVFDPSALAPGRYEVKAELIGPDGAAGAAQTVAFERIPN